MAQPPTATALGIRTNVAKRDLAWNPLAVAAPGVTQKPASLTCPTPWPATWNPPVPPAPWPPAGSWQARPDLLTCAFPAAGAAVAPVLHLRQTKLIDAIAGTAKVIPTNRLGLIDRQGHRGNRNEWYYRADGGTAGAGPLNGFLASAPLSSRGPVAGQFSLRSHRACALPPFGLVGSTMVVLVRVRSCATANAPTAVELADLRKCYHNALEQAMNPYNPPGGVLAPSANIVLPLLGTGPNYSYGWANAANHAIRALREYFYPTPGIAKVPVGATQIAANAIGLARRNHFTNIYITIPPGEGLSADRKKNAFSKTMTNGESALTQAIL
ncbi:hypothetical protein BDZ45DRAFT_737433 [Acephala macrosclerotiorum]|nr:hypothetical protein BDZ45DRAFT_737433 [Acephala macrosclerotiorum]